MGCNTGYLVVDLPGLSGATAGGRMVQAWDADVGKALVTCTGRHVVCSSRGLQVGRSGAGWRLAPENVLSLRWV